MIDTSTAIKFTIANPSVNVKPTAHGYSVSAVESNSLGAKLGKIALFLFCLVFLAAGVVVWFLPDSVFEGEPLLLKSIVSSTTWLIFAPLLIFNFINTTTQSVELDTSRQQLHQIFRGKNGQETKRRTYDFSEIKEFDLRSSANQTSTNFEDRVSSYGQIYLRLSATTGRSLVWGQLSDLKPVWSMMRQDVLGQ